MTNIHTLGLRLATWEEIHTLRMPNVVFHYAGFDTEGEPVIHTDLLKQAYDDPRVAVISTRLEDGTWIYFKVMR